MFACGYSGVRVVRVIIVDFSYIKYVSKLPVYQAIVNFQIRSKSFKTFLGRLKGHNVNARISVKILPRLCSLSYKYTLHM